MTAPHRPASDIVVDQFTLLLQWPFVLVPPKGIGTLSERIERALASTRKALRQENWCQTDGLTMLGADLCAPENRERAARASYGEFAYFHDFLQDALYPEANRKDSAVEVWRNDGVTGLEFDLPGAQTLKFALARRTLHLFGFGCAIITLELACTRQGNLSLAEVQRALDYIRRSYAPYFNGGQAQRCPTKVRLIFAPKDGDSGICHKDYPSPHENAVMNAWEKVRQDTRSTHRDIPVFDHWSALIKPLDLLSNCGQWRDPSDERIPINSYIRLKVPDQPVEDAELSAAFTQFALDNRFDDKGQDTLTNDVANLKSAKAIAAIHPADWYRIADAEEPADTKKLQDASWPYNAEFCTTAAGKPIYYDRFMPDAGSPGMATRHIFAGQHYSVVGAGWFFENYIHDHFRRHYAQMSLVARFEQTALLAISSRLTEAVRDLQEGAANLSRAARHDRQKAFESAVLDIQSQFLGFVHRFRFTGVSNQMQGREMFEHWRTTLGLDTVFQEVKDELDAAVSAVRARQSERESNAARKLNLIVAVLGFVALYLSALSVIGTLRLLPLPFDLWSMTPKGMEWAATKGDLLAVLVPLVVLGIGTVAVIFGAQLLLRWWRKTVMLR